MDSFKSIFFVAGLGMFILAFIASGVLPVMTLSDLEYSTMDDIAADPIPEWRDLAERWPEAFTDAFGEEARQQALQLPKTLRESPEDPAAVSATIAAYKEALDRGRDLYVGEACWHCHSQFIRGVSKEEQRWGPVAMADEYVNALQKPQLWGTRRVGPDLSREWGRHTNDWHAAHLYNPTATSPDSVMPAYTWYFRDNPAYRPEAEVRAEAASMSPDDAAAFLRKELSRTPKEPTKDGFALITFIQWLGSWRPERPWDEAP
ncbi:MAG: cytochrome-c oxidase [Planctomycetota bacterium]|nr:MAG: cytochrome-c oxidase [Planctomycetota bacterium]